MTIAIDIQKKVLDLLKQGYAVQKVLKKMAGQISKSSIYNYKKAWINDGYLEAKLKVTTTKTRADYEWDEKDYLPEDQSAGKLLKEKYEQSFKSIGKLPAGYNINLDNEHYIESFAREKYHGKTFEDSLHLGIYQIKKNDQVRSKKVGNYVLKLTSQNHIFPHSKMSDKTDSFHPENIREGNAVVNNYIGNAIDPIFDNNGKNLSNSTFAMIKKYNLFKDLKDHLSFKYIEEDRIMTSNMVSNLSRSLKGGYEAPELGKMPESNNVYAEKKIISMHQYSVPLYKLESLAGILDVSTRNSDLKNVLHKNRDIKQEVLVQDESKFDCKSYLESNIQSTKFDDVQSIADLFASYDVE